MGGPDAVPDTECKITPPAVVLLRLALSPGLFTAASARRECGVRPRFQVPVYDTRDIHPSSWPLSLLFLLHVLFSHDCLLSFY